MNFKKYIKDLFNNYGYSLNYIQKQAGKENNKGRSMIISAETGSGKTEAALIAVRNGVTGIDIMLPYISACNFMYNRLKKQFPQKIFLFKVMTLIVKVIGIPHCSFSEKQYLLLIKQQKKAGSC